MLSPFGHAPKLPAGQRVVRVTGHRTDADQLRHAAVLDDERRRVTLSQITVAERFAIRIEILKVNAALGAPDRLAGALVQRGNELATQAGKIQLSRFVNPGGLMSIGNNLFIESPASGTEETGDPGATGFGSLAQGYLELSNVKVVEEMVNLIKAQRAYEINSKAIQAADEMMQMSNRLRG